MKFFFIDSKKILWGLLGVVVAVSFIFSYLVFKDGQIKDQDYLTKLDQDEIVKPKQGDGSDSKNLPGKLVINENTEIITRVIYEQTGQEEVTKIKATEDMKGLSKEDLERVYNGWIIDEFTPSKVHLTLVVRKQAEGVGLTQYYLGVKDGHVAVFKEPPGPKASLKQLTKIPIKSLPDQEVKDLEKGIQVKSEEELLEILEGLSSYGEY